MTRKEIQEQRMREYFIQATKDILKGEGINALSVRNIAERAGYSFATLYNYFKDVKELVFLCVKDFQEECEEYVKQNTKKGKKGSKKIKSIIMSYVEYFVQYPGVFDLFFVEKLSSISTGITSTELIVSLPARLCAEEWEECIDNGTYTRAETEIMDSEILNITTGLLLLYMNRHYPRSHDDFISELKMQLDRILKEKLLPEH